MGFFDSILDGISSVGGWLGDNAGNLLNVANAIAKVAGTAALDEESLDDDSNIYPRIFADLPLAQTNMYNYIATIAPIPKNWTKTETAHAFRSPYDPGLGGPYDMTGLWMNPGEDPSGMAPASVLSDIRKFLAANKIPLVLSGGNSENGETIDVAQQLAAQMFTATSGQSPADGTTFPSVPISIDTPQYQISGAHCYYSIPLGTNGSPNGAWHAYLRLYKNSTTSFEQERVARARGLRLKSNGLTFPPNTWVNTTIVSATWPGLTWQNDEVSTIMSNAANAMAAITSGGEPVYQLQGSWMGAVGTVYKYTWVTDLTVGSHSVLSAFTGAIGDALPTVSSTELAPSGPAIEMVFQQSGVVPPSTT